MVNENNNVVGHASTNKKFGFFAQYVGNTCCEEKSHENMFFLRLHGGRSEFGITHRREIKHESNANEVVQENKNYENNFFCTFRGRKRGKSERGIYMRVSLIVFELFDLLCSK
jgi:hypothetical protein